MFKKFTFIFFLVLSFKLGNSQDYICTIRNIVNPNPNTIEFDIYLKATGSNALLLQTFQGGIDFNYAGLANGGIISGAFAPFAVGQPNCGYVPNSSWNPGTSAQLLPPQNFCNWNINPISQQIRLLASVQTANSIAAIIPTAGDGLKLGTFRMVNTVPFTNCSKPNFTWSFITASNKTKSLVTAYVNGAATGSNLTDPAHPPASFSNGGGPQHFVESNPTINNIIASTTPIFQNACDSFTWYGNTYYNSGIFNHALTNVQGCDSVIQLNLSINNNNGSSSLTTCGQYTWPSNGITYNSSGVYTTTFVNGFGCTQHDTLNLTITPDTTINQTVTECDSYFWSVNNTTYTTSGTYTASFTLPNGCIQYNNLYLTINNSTSNNTNQIVCDNYFWPETGINYTTSGVYFSTSLNPAGCTHTETLNLIVNYSTSSSQTVTECDSYIWPANGQTYFNSGTFIYQSLNAAGCPDTKTLFLTIKQSSESYDTLINCSPITWNGQNLIASGNYTYTTPNAVGCDSTVYLSFTLLPSLTDTQTVYNCGPYTVAGNTYNTSGTYFYQVLNPFGCVVNVTLYLTITPNTFNTINVSQCGSYYYGGTVYTTSGTYTHITTNSFGCDSIITLNLNIFNNTAVSQFINVCDSFTILGNTYYSSGNYIVNGTTVNGCDSTIYLNLTIKKSSFSNTNQIAVFSYTWPANGLTYYQSGQYTYQSVNSSGCSQFDTLNLTIDFPNGVEFVDDNNSFHIYPNPSSDIINLDFETSQSQEFVIYLSDLSGRKVIQMNYSATEGKHHFPISIFNLAKGIYMLDIKQTSGLKVLSRPIIKE